MGKIKISENKENGTLSVKAQMNYEPKSEEDILNIHKIDYNIWKLSQFWSSQRGNKWFTSATFTRKKHLELSREDIDNVVKDIFYKNKVSPQRIYPVIPKNKSLFVYVSDKHIAAMVKDSLYENEYNESVLESRLKKLLDEIGYQRGIFGVFEDIFIIDLGDKMDGWNALTTRGGHKLPQNMSNREAFDVALRTEKNFIETLVASKFAKKYHFYFNSNSNHGGDFDYIVNRSIQEYINVKYPEIEVRHMQKFIEHFTYGKHTFLCTHGKDTEDMKFGLPLMLNDKTENFISKYLIINNINPKETNVSLVKGDLHQNASISGFKMRYKNVPSLFGSSKWIHHNFGPGSPGVAFDVIEKNSDRIYESCITF